MVVFEETADVVLIPLNKDDAADEKALRDRGVVGFLCSFVLGVPFIQRVVGPKHKRLKRRVALYKGNEGADLSIMNVCIVPIRLFLRCLHEISVVHSKTKF